VADSDIWQEVWGRSRQGVKSVLLASAAGLMDDWHHMAIEGLVEGVLDNWEYEMREDMAGASFGIQKPAIAGPQYKRGQIKRPKSRLQTQQAVRAEHYLGLDRGPLYDD
jgi:hypothetical protein